MTGVQTCAPDLATPPHLLPAPRRPTLRWIWLDPDPPPASHLPLAPGLVATSSRVPGGRPPLRRRTGPGRPTHPLANTHTSRGCNSSSCYAPPPNPCSLAAPLDPRPAALNHSVRAQHQSPQPLRCYAQTPDSASQLPAPSRPGCSTSPRSSISDPRSVLSGAVHKPLHCSPLPRCVHRQATPRVSRRGPPLRGTASTDLRPPFCPCTSCHSSPCNPASPDLQCTCAQDAVPRVAVQSTPPCSSLTRSSDSPELHDLHQCGGRARCGLAAV